MVDPIQTDQLSSEVRRAILVKVAWLTLAVVSGSLLITTAIIFLFTGVWPDALALLVATLTPLLIVPGAGYANTSLFYRLQAANERLQALSETDPLTGALNRRCFVEVAERELALAERHCYPTSVVLLDFDDFKLINDRYGHAVGDRVLVQTIAVMQEVIRESDVLARFGGEEFILLLPHTARDGAQSLSERLRQAVEKTAVTVADTTLQVTVSVGSVTCETSATPLDVLMSKADELLYESKHRGRNCSVAETIINIVPQYRRA